MLWLEAIGETLPAPTRLRVQGRSMLPTLRPGDEVVVQPATAEALAPGDWVVVRNAQGAFLHRYLGRCAGRILTKGDGHRALDPAWPPEAVLGRVVEAQRAGRCFYRRAPGQCRRERWLALGHGAFGEVWGALRRVKALLLGFLAVLLVASLVWAAVTLTNFTAEVRANSITLKWETASETNNLGFRLWRSLATGGSYVDISGFIETLDEGAGAIYQYEDVNVTPGVTYYYKLQDAPDDGSLGDYTTPIAAMVPLNSTTTLTPTATATATESPEGTPSTATLTPTPNPYVRFWSDKTDLAAGECATLYWQTNNILTLHLNNVGVAGDGERRVCPCATESHTLRVKYLNGATEGFVITLNVTGQCGATPPATAPTATLSPREPIADRATATPRYTSTPGPTLSPPARTATASAEAFIATATASTEAWLATATASAALHATTQPLAQATPPMADLTDWPPATLAGAPEAQPETLADVGARTSGALPTRGPVEGETSGTPVEQVLSIWLLIVGGIVGAGFVGAGILMWKRQQ